MDEGWNADDYVQKLLQLLGGEASRAAVLAREDEVRLLFRQAYADGVENGMLAAQAANPLP